MALNLETLTAKPMSRNMAYYVMQWQTQDNAHYVSALLFTRYVRLQVQVCSFGLHTLKRKGGGGGQGAARGWALQFSDDHQQATC